MHRLLHQLAVLHIAFAEAGLLQPVRIGIRVLHNRLPINRIVAKVKSEGIGVPVFVGTQ